MLPHHVPRCAAAVSTLLAAVTIALAGLPARAVAADYLWPTDASRCVTGGLCEFRPGHFHSGIDISTQGKVGFKAIAVADGDVVRARVTCGGYGRALYLRLADGRTAVYAHLSRFAGAVGDSIRTRQLDAGDAYLDVSFPPGRFPVKAGDTVAWTGQSGVGVPHLHFEIRDEAERPLDPLREGFGVPDTTPPVPLRLALTPLDATSSVDGRADTMVYDVIPDGANHEGRLARTIPVEGEIGVALEIDESTNACKFRLAPARLELREGEERIYAVDYRGFAFSQSAQQDYQIDPRFSYSKIGRFHRVYLCAGNELPVVEDLAGRGGVLRAGRGPAESRRLRRPAGDTADSSSAFPLAASVQVGEAREREYTVEIEDAAGNRGRVTFTLSFGAPPEVAALSLFAEAEPDSEPDPWAADLTASWADTLTEVGAVREGGRPLDRVHLDWSPEQGVTWFDEPDATIRPDGSFRGQIAIAGRIPGQGRASVVVRAQPVDRLGAVGLARSVAPDGAEAPPPLVPTFEVVTHGGFV
ncbi:MAG: M23 family metallopeptidase, partial [Gemmatimonadetes bacterium]|nr:M23 family metallopeptidase [Gemmatimonadota bacterium]